MWLKKPRAEFNVFNDPNKRIEIIDSNMWNITCRYVRDIEKQYIKI